MPFSQSEFLQCSSYFPYMDVSPNKVKKRKSSPECAELCTINYYILKELNSVLVIFSY